jgi:hypothetical protein
MAKTIGENCVVVRKLLAKVHFKWYALAYDVAV